MGGRLLKRQATSRRRRLSWLGCLLIAGKELLQQWH
jgi:hypothetical protein